jgi:phosphoglycerate dehydrogenase-like enzyme
MAQFNIRDEKIKSVRIAILDDYQQVAFKFADWSKILGCATVSVFEDHLDDENQLIDRLSAFHIICLMRERTALTCQIIRQLPNLRLIISTGTRNSSLDTLACERLGIKVAMTNYLDSGAPELTWALLMALSKNIVKENGNLRNKNWQTMMGIDLKGKTIGIIGLGKIGCKIAKYANAFDMKVIAWSENLTVVRAEENGAELVTKKEIFQQSDFITLHLVLSERSKYTVGHEELALMKAEAYLINTSRGMLIHENALIAALSTGRIAGAALDVFEKEPLPPCHPFRLLNNVLATPHIGYVTENTYKIFFEDTVKSIENWLCENFRN